MKPMIKYAGGKSREIEIIKRFIPEYKGRYIEGPYIFILSLKNQL